MFGKPDCIQIDGDFKDWHNVPMYANTYTDQPADNVNLVKYAVTMKGDDLSFYVEVAGDILKSIPSNAYGVGWAEGKDGFTFFL
jgi:hypothetical protein